MLFVDGRVSDEGVLEYVVLAIKYRSFTGTSRSCAHRWSVCVFSSHPCILDVQFVGCTSRGGHTGGRSHITISHPPTFCGACLYFSREKDSAVPFPRRP